MSKSGSLPVLLAHALLDINRAFEQAGAEDGERPNLVTWICDSHASIVDGVTQAWRERYGPDVVDALAKSLAHVDAQLGSDLPDDVLVRHSATDGFADISFEVA